MISDRNQLEITLTNDNYSDNIVLLFNQIKNILIDEIKKYDPEYTYTNIIDFKNKALHYLTKENQQLAITLYALVMNPLEEYLECNILMNMYNELSIKKR